MARTGPRRTLVACKLTDDGISWLDERALAEGFTIRGGEANRSEMMRLAFAFAAAKMPAGWRPKTTTTNEGA
jgi:hypothetical protein